MNPTTVHYLNLFLGSGAIFLQVSSAVVLFLLFFVSYGNKKTYILLDFIKKHFLIIGFLISFVAVFSSLVYSEIIGFIACELCWFQRVFVFPQIFIYATALWNKDKNVIKYSTPILCVGFAISIYQNMVYYFGDASNIPCDASGVSCYQNLVSEFNGYISIPMLSLTTFFVLLTLNLVAYFYKKQQFVAINNENNK
jgi:disulfide bond formation protein DsbB